MGVRVLQHGQSALYDSTTGQAFGPIFESESDAEAFIAFAYKNGVDDLRTIHKNERDDLYNAFMMEMNDSLFARTEVCAYENEHSTNNNCNGIHTWVYPTKEK